MAGKPRRWGKRFRSKKRSRVGLWTIVALVVLGSAYAGVLDLSRPHVHGDPLRFDTFIGLAAGKRIQSATILDQDSYIVGTYVPDAAGGGQRPVQLPEMMGGFKPPTPAAGAPPVVAGPSRPYRTPLVQGTQGPLLQLFLDNGIPVTIDQQVGKRVAALASLLLPGLIIVVLLVYLLLSSRRGSGLFGIRSGARRVKPDETTVRFADVAGQQAAITELREIKEFLTEPDRFADLGALIPKGILLFGPPGCGKTLLAKALAGEAGAAFYSISGSDFIEVYVGVGAARVRDLFREARENAPAIIFIDELDSIGRSRGQTGTVVSNSEQEQSLNQILAEMDGFSPSEGIIVLGATNRPDILDPALLRPGRFDRTVGLERPDEAARLSILNLHARTRRLVVGTDLRPIANRAIGLTGADLANVINEAALLAARDRQTALNQDVLDRALQRIMEAPERQRRLSLRERSVARRFSAEERVTFADVAGVDDAIVELAQVKEYLAEPARFAKLGAKVPRGFLLVGPPGCGKTLLARAVAGEANAAFFSVAGSEFVEVFAGQGASRVRDLFAEARSVAPAIVFIDEIDAVGSHRGTALSGGGREGDQTLNQILVELDGFTPDTGLILIAATNRVDMLDAALLRPGRIDRQIEICPPDRAGRRQILNVCARGKPLAADVNLDTVAGLCRGFTGAELANVMNQAALLATRRNLTHIPMDIVEEGVDRAIMGVSSHGNIMSDDERRSVAYHEAGHAIVAWALPGAEPPHKLSIAGRNSNLGHTIQLGRTDRMTMTRSALIDEMAVCTAGLVAEELVYGQPGTGSTSDLAKVGQIARHMVRDLGMSPAVGPLGWPTETQNAYSDEAARLIDHETRNLAIEAYQRAQTVLQDARPLLDRVTAALLEHETLTATDLDTLAQTTPPHNPPNTPRPTTRKAPAAEHKTGRS